MLVFSPLLVDIGLRDSLAISIMRNWALKLEDLSLFWFPPPLFQMPDPSYHISIHIWSEVIDYCLYMRVEFGRRICGLKLYHFQPGVPILGMSLYRGRFSKMAKNGRSTSSQCCELVYCLFSPSDNVVGRSVEQGLSGSLEIATQSLAPGFLVLDTVLYVFGKCLTSELCVCDWGQ